MSWEVLSVERPWTTVIFPKPAQETPARWNFLWRTLDETDACCVNVYLWGFVLWQCPHNVHKLDGYMCDNSQVRSGSLFLPTLMLGLYALPALFNLHRDAAMVDAAGLVMDSAKDSGAIVCLQTDTTIISSCDINMWSTLTASLLILDQIQQTGSVMRSWTLKVQRRGTVVGGLKGKAGCSATSRE